MAEPFGNTPADPQIPAATPGASDTLPPKTTPPVAGAKVEPPVDVEQLKNELTKKDTIARTAQTETAETKRLLREEKMNRIKLEKQIKSIQKGETVVPTFESGSSESEQQIQLKVQLGIKDLIIDNPQYKELIDNDPTLLEVVKNNPFVLIGDYFDAPDAIEQFKGKLDNIISKRKPQPAAPAAAPEAPIIESKVIQKPDEKPAPSSDNNFGFPQTNDSVADSIGKKVKFI